MSDESAFTDLGQQGSEGSTVTFEEIVLGIHRQDC